VTGKLPAAVLAAVVLAAAAVSFAVARIAASGPPPAASATLPARPASYLGVYAAGAPASDQAVTTFARAAGRQPNLAGYFSGWSQPFDSSFARTARGHGAVTLVQIDPGLASVAAIAAGDYDSYLRAFAGSVRDFGHPVVIGFGPEMNAPWYSWGYRHVPAAVFVAAWRHIVTLFRGQGAGNVTWLWTVNADTAGTGPVAAWWPGAAYVTWAGIDGYFYRPSDTFASVFGRTISQVRALTGRPVLLSETAVGPGNGRAAAIGGLFRGMRQDGLLGLVWFDIAQHNGIYHQDWRIQDSQAAQTAFRLGVRDDLAPASP
jgi:mannan endo-1,4-beta-mannosidase